MRIDGLSSKTATWSHNRSIFSAEALSARILIATAIERPVQAREVRILIHPSEVRNWVMSVGLAGASVISGLPRQADVRRRRRDFAFGPQAEVETLLQRRGGEPFYEADPPPLDRVRQQLAWRHASYFANNITRRRP